MYLNKEQPVSYVLTVCIIAAKTNYQRTKMARNSHSVFHSAYKTCLRSCHDNTARTQLGRELLAALLAAKVHRFDASSPATPQAAKYITGVAIQHRNHQTLNPAFQMTSNEK